MTTATEPSEASLPEKLGIGPGMRVTLLHAPDEMEAAFDSLPEGAQLQHGLRRSQQVDLIVGFVVDQDHLARNIGWLTATLSPEGAFWVAWPKKGSQIATDMSADAVREIALPIGWADAANDAKACDIDATWTGLKLVRRETLLPECS